MKFLEALLNTFWQAALLALVAWAVTRLVPRINAATRFAVWWIVLLAVLVLPFTQIRRPVPAPSMGAAVYVSDAAAHTSTRTFIRTVSAPPPPPFELRRSAWQDVLVVLWLAVFTAQFARLAASFFFIRRLKRDALPAPAAHHALFDELLRANGIRRPARLLLSARVPSPVAVGFLRPAVLLPDDLPQHLTPAELRHVLLHEIAHIARLDDWSHLAVCFGWSVFALHPVTAWVLHRIEREREIACDDWVVAATGAPRPYAQSLARLFDLCTPRHRVLLASGITGAGSQLGDRIALLLERGRAFTARVSPARVAGCTVVLLAIAGALSHAPVMVAFAQQSAHPSTPHPAAPASHSFLAAVVAAGYGDLSVDDIVNLKIQGVSGEYLMEMSKAGWGKLPPSKVIHLKVQGVHPEYPREIHALGFGPYTPEQIVNLKTQDVPVELFRALKDYGIREVSASEVIEAKIHGLGAQNLREARTYGPSLTLHQIVKLKQAGVI